MRLGVCDSFHPLWPKFAWVVDAARRLGHEVVELRNEHSLARAIDERLDLALFSQRSPVDPSAVKLLSLSRRCPWVSWVFDLLGHGAGDLLLREIDWSAYDFVFAKNPEPLRDLGIDARWLDQGAPAWDVEPGGARPIDALMAGRWTERREWLAAQCAAAGLAVATAGDERWRRCGLNYREGEHRSDTGARALFASAKVILGDNLAALSGYWSDRMWMALAAGCCYVGPWVERLPLSLSGCLLWDRERDAAWLARTAVEEWPARSEAALACAAANGYGDRLAQLIEQVEAARPCGAL